MTDTFVAYQYRRADSCYTPAHTAPEPLPAGKESAPRPLTAPASARCGTTADANAPAQSPSAPGR